MYERIVPVGMTDGSGQPWQFAGTYTSTPISFRPSIQQVGDTMWLVARWVTRRGEVGSFGEARGLPVPQFVLQKGSTNQIERRRAA